MTVFHLSSTPLRIKVKALLRLRNKQPAAAGVSEFFNY